MSGLLLDTHVWWWYLTGSDRLPARLRSSVEEVPGNGWLSPISLWEAGMLVDRGRIAVPGSEFAPWARTALRRWPLHEAALTTEVALASLRVQLPHRDPADRFLAATAVVYGLTLVTVDERLLGAPQVSTLAF